MDFLNQIGPLALGSRFRRLADRLGQDVALLYKEMELDFEPRWFPVFYLLSRSREPIGVVDISRLLGVSHPAVNQIAGELLDLDLIQALRDDTDKRKRLLALSEKGWDVLPELQNAWERIQITMRGLLNATGVDVMGMLERMENLMDEQGLYGRFIAEQAATHSSPDATGTVIVEYRPGNPVYREAFRRLNLEWIEKYFKVESEDEKVLGDPEREILDNGGAILFAVSHDSLDGQAGSSEQLEAILGTCALIKKEDGTFELSKMAVTEKARGRQIGEQLLAASIEKARKLEAGKLVLETNSQLTAAVNLYRKLGFVLIQDEPEHRSLYQRADTRMRLDL